MYKKKKKFILPVTPYAFIIFGVLFISTIALLIALQNIAFIVLSIITGIGLFYWGMFFFKTLHFTMEGVIRGKKKLFWNEIKIVLFPMNFFWVRGYRYCFVIDYKYCETRQDIKEQKKAGFYLLLNKNNLIDLCEYYKNKIIIVDRYCCVDKENIPMKYKSIIEKHNKQFIED